MLDNQNTAMKRTIDRLLGKLNIEEKVAQLMVLGLTGTFVEPELVEFIDKYGLGGLRLSPHLARKFVRYLPDGSPGSKNVVRKASLREKIFDNSIAPMHVTAPEYAGILNQLRKKAFDKHGLPLHMVADYESGGGDFTPKGREVYQNNPDAYPNLAWSLNNFAKAKVPVSSIILVEETSVAIFPSVTNCDQDNSLNNCTSTDIGHHDSTSLLLADGHTGKMRFFDAAQFTYFTTEMSAWK